MSTVTSNSIEGTLQDSEQIANLFHNALIDGQLIGAISEIRNNSFFLNTFNRRVLMLSMSHYLHVDEDQCVKAFKNLPNERRWEIEAMLEAYWKLG